MLRLQMQLERVLHASRVGHGHVVAVVGKQRGNSYQLARATGLVSSKVGSCRAL